MEFGLAIYLYRSLERVKSFENGFLKIVHMKWRLGPVFKTKLDVGHENTTSLSLGQSLTCEVFQHGVRLRSCKQYFSETVQDFKQD